MDRISRIIPLLQMAGGAGLLFLGGIELVMEPSLIDYFAIVFGTFFFATGTLGFLKGKVY